MTQTQVVTMPYILGLMEADGSIILTFGTGNSTRTLKPWVRISQKSNQNLLPMIEDFFVNNGIDCHYERWNPATSKGRAPNLTITKVDSVRKFIELVKKEPFQFLSQKQRDFYILDCVLNTPSVLTIEDKVNLKLNMHKANMDQPDVHQAGKKTRDELEEKYSISSGASNVDALGILKQIDQAYANHTDKIQQSIANGEFTLPVDWLAGLIDGDGSFYVTMRAREPSKRYNKRYLEIEANFTISMEKNALITLQALKFVVGSKAPIKESKNHYQFWIRNISEVKKLLQLQKAYLPVGDYRLAQYNLVQKIHTYKEKGMMKDGNVVLNIVRETYALSAHSKGRERTKSLAEMEAIVKNIYGLII